MGRVGEDSAYGHSATRRRIVGKAQSKLRLAKTLMKENRAKGKRWLREVIEGFPNTLAAKEAKELLGEN